MLSHLKKKLLRLEGMGVFAWFIGLYSDFSMTHVFKNVEVDRFRFISI